MRMAQMMMRMSRMIVKRPWRDAPFVLCSCSWPLVSHVHPPVDHDDEYFDMI